MTQGERFSSPFFLQTKDINGSDTEIRCLRSSFRDGSLVPQTNIDELGIKQQGHHCYLVMRGLEKKSNNSLSHTHIFDHSFEIDAFILFNFSSNGIRCYATPPDNESSARNRQMYFRCHYVGGCFFEKGRERETLLLISKGERKKEHQ